MAFFVRPLTAYEEKVIKNLAAEYRHDPAFVRRLNIILLSGQRLKSGEIALQLQATPSTIVEWIKRFNQLGLSCLEQGLSRPVNTPTYPAQAPEPLYVRKLSSDEIEAIKQLIRQYQHRPRFVRQLQTILLSDQKISVSDIVRNVGGTKKTVISWIQKFNIGGIEYLEMVGNKKPNANFHKDG